MQKGPLERQTGTGQERGGCLRLMVDGIIMKLYHSPIPRVGLCYCGGGLCYSLMLCMGEALHKQILAVNMQLSRLTLFAGVQARPVRVEQEQGKDDNQALPLQNLRRCEGTVEFFLLLDGFCRSQSCMLFIARHCYGRGDFAYTSRLVADRTAEDGAERTGNRAGH